MRLLIHFVVLFTCWMKFADAQFDAFVRPDPETLADENVVLENWKTLEHRVQNMSEELMNSIYPFLIDLMGSLNISRSCFRDSTKLFLGVRRLDTWAIKFIDASTKSFDGILSLQMPSLGSYDECVDNEVFFRPHGNNKKGKLMFQGSYCSIEMRPYLKRDELAGLLGTKDTGITTSNYSENSVFYEIASVAGYVYFVAVKAGMCVPSGCSTDDVNVILRKVSDYIGFSVKATRCAVKQEKKFTAVVIGVLTAYSLAGFLMLLGTMIDIYDIYFHLSKKSAKNVGVQILKAFSFISNFKKLTNTSSLKTDCLNGMRFLSLSWVIMGHTTMITSSTNRSLPRNFQEYAWDIALQAVLNGTPSVSTFFFISGFLVCYVTTKLVKIEKNTFNFAWYVLHRLWRILPAYAFVIGYEFIKPLTGSGPLFYETFVLYTEYCEKHWWTNVLFINNYYGRNEMCLPHSWFIAVDMQLYLLAPIVLLPLMRWPKIGLFLAGTTIVGCTTLAAVRSYVHNTMTTFILSLSQKGLEFFHHDNNLNPYFHAPAYCVGLLLGYILATRNDFKVSKGLQVLGWSASTAMCLAVVYGVRNWNAGVAPTLWETTIYSGYWRLAWTLGVAWMTFCCCTGYGGVVNYILSWKVWAPLSRLTYFAYLVHLTVVMSYSANMRSLIRLEYYIVVWTFLGHILVTYAVAFAGSMLIEAPFLSLEKIMAVNRLKTEDLPSPKGFESKDQYKELNVKVENGPQMKNMLSQNSNDSLKEQLNMTSME